MAILLTRKRQEGERFFEPKDGAKAMSSSLGVERAHRPHEIVGRPTNSEFGSLLPNSFK
jgi:hypothetical protein